MNQNRAAWFLFFITLLLFFSTAYSQEVKDTIYFDEDFSICEKPVAEYYRVCILNKEGNLFYKGKVEDYFIDGKIKMRGFYKEENGFKDGEFIFYNQNGTISKKGVYTLGEMIGNWQFYDTTGNLKAIFKCKSSADATPILLINSNNDTVLKNGHGRFILSTQKDFPFIFSSPTNYIVEGNVADSLKTGLYNFSIYLGNRELASKEKYNKGNLKGEKTGMLSLSAKILNLEDQKLAKVDAFNHSNIVFGPGTEGMQKLINFLMYKIRPEIPAQAKKLSDNYAIAFELIGYVLKQSLYQLNPETFVNSLKEDPIDMYYSLVKNDMVFIYFLSKNNILKKSKARLIQGNITLIIDTLGYIGDYIFDTNLTEAEIKKISYYLQHTSNLIAPNNGTQKQTLMLQLRLNTFLDTLNQNSINYKYAIYNADSLDDNTVLDYITPLSEKFPGGTNAWLNFLAQNLNATIPALNNAPNGRYIVTVSFYVDAGGNVSDVKADTDPGYGTAEEVIRVFKKLSKWKPASKNGKPIGYRQKQNIIFQVSGQ